MPARLFTILTLLFAALPLVTGCQRSLFADADPSTEIRLKRYYDGDSARETTESRRKNAGMGFGFPTGGGLQ
jgi:hypothetical protein